MPHSADRLGFVRRVFHYPAELGRLLAGGWTRRHSYANLWEAAKAVALRIAATRPVRLLLTPRTATLRLRGAQAPLVLRWGTSDIRAAQEIFELGAYEAVRSCPLPKQPVLVDLGGNIGLATVFLSHLFPDARVIIVEPDRENCRILEKNCRALLDRGQAILVPAFIGATDGLAGIDRTRDSWEFRKTDPPPAAGERIECLSLRTLLGRHGLERIDLLKCDIEGSEAELFQDCRPWIHVVGHLMVETHSPYSPVKLFEDLRRAGWEFRTLQISEGTSIAHCLLARRA